MTLGGVMLILLPVCCLLSSGSLAASLSGQEGECNRQGGGKQKSQMMDHDNQKGSTL